jgi:hypothetical protein
MKITKEELKIVRTDDEGFIIKIETPNIDENGLFLGMEETVEIVNNEEEKESIINLLYKVADWCGYNYDKYSKENINITWDKKGHKAVDDEDKKEEN